MKTHIKKAHSAAPADVSSNVGDVTVEEMDQSETSFVSASGNLLDDINKQLEDLEKMTSELDSSASSLETDNETSPKMKKERKRKLAKKHPFTDKLAEDLLKQGIDLEKSVYFKSQKGNIISCGEKSSHHFTSEDPSLPEGWKTRHLETTMNGKVVPLKRYLSPSNILIKSTLGVIEYLRLEGKMSREELQDLAKAFKVGQSKLNRLYVQEDVANETLETEEAVEAVADESVEMNDSTEESVEMDDISTEASVEMNDTSTEASVDKGQRQRTAADNKFLVELLMKEGIDLEKSNYFRTTKQVMHHGKNQIHHFVEDKTVGLPEGWKVRTLSNNRKGKVVNQKHFLAPSSEVVIQSTLGVIEYLRLEGKLNPEALLDLAKSMKVGSSKLKKLYANEVSANDETVAEA